jgi:hypothetical protein
VCGIAGVYYFREPARPVDPALLDAMTVANRDILEVLQKGELPVHGC